MLVLEQACSPVQFSCPTTQILWKKVLETKEIKLFNFDCVIWGNIKSLDSVTEYGNLRYFYWFKSFVPFKDASIFAPLSFMVLSTDEHSCKEKNFIFMISNFNK